MCKFFIKVFILLTLVFSVSSLAEHQWGVYHWKIYESPLSLDVIDSMTGEWDDALSESVSQWSVPSNVILMKLEGTISKSSRKKCSYEKGKIRSCNASYGNTGWLGLASIRVQSGHITMGTLKVNDFYSNYWDGTEEEANRRQYVVCQEIGHTLGLDHTSTDGSSQNTCMDYSNGKLVDIPNLHDIDFLDLIYAHETIHMVEEENTICRGRGCKNKVGFGLSFPVRIRLHSSEHHEVWVEALGQDDFWIHHVILLPKEFK